MLLTGELNRLVKTYNALRYDVLMEATQLSGVVWTCRLVWLCGAGIPLVMPDYAHVDRVKRCIIVGFH